MSSLIRTVRMIAWLKLDKITSNKNIKVIKILDKRLETCLDEEDNGWYFKCEYEVLS